MGPCVMEGEDVWVVGRYPNADETDLTQWQLQGVYSSREAAHEAAEPGWFLGPVPFDTPLIHESEPWPSVEYVLKEREA